VKTIASWAASASNLLGAVVNGRPVMLSDFLGNLFGKANR
jgi:hypothetical protein